MSKKITVAFLIWFLISGGCQYKKEMISAENCSTVSYSIQIAGIIEQNCTKSGCHSAGTSNVGGPFTSYTLVKNKVAKIKQQVASGAMPKGFALSDADKQAISCWVDAGAPDN